MCRRVTDVGIFHQIEALAKQSKRARLKVAASLSKRTGQALHDARVSLIAAINDDVSWVDPARSCISEIDKLEAEHIAQLDDALDYLIRVCSDELHSLAHDIRQLPS